MTHRITFARPNNVHTCMSRTKGARGLLIVEFSAGPAKSKSRSRYSKEPSPRQREWTEHARRIIPRSALEGSSVSQHSSALPRGRGLINPRPSHPLPTWSSGPSRAVCFPRAPRENGGPKAAMPLIYTYVCTRHGTHVKVRERKEQSGGGENRRAGALLAQRGIERACEPLLATWPRARRSLRNKHCRNNNGSTDYYVGYISPGAPRVTPRLRAAHQRCGGIVHQGRFLSARDRHPRIIGPVSSAVRASRRY